MRMTSNHHTPYSMCDIPTTMGEAKSHDPMKIIVKIASNH